MWFKGLFRINSPFVALQALAGMQDSPAAPYFPPFPSEGVLLYLATEYY
jgi:hypothetical protein